MSMFDDPIAKERSQTKFTRTTVPKRERTPEEINQAIKDYIDTKAKDFSVLTLVKRELGIKSEAELINGQASELFKSLLAKSPKLRALYNQIAKRNLPKE